MGNYNQNNNALLAILNTCQLSNDRSQNGESKIILEWLKKIVMLPGIEQYFPEGLSMIEIGAGDGETLSNSFMFRQAIMFHVEQVDMENHGNEMVKKRFVTAGNVCQIMESLRRSSWGVVSLDIDGNDYFVLREILRNQSPVMVCFEVNSQLPLDMALTMPYNANHVWDGSWFYGMSYLAAAQLCRLYGYKIIDVVNNTNIIAIKKEIDIKPNLYSFGLTWSHPETKSLEEFQKV